MPRLKKIATATALIGLIGTGAWGVNYALQPAYAGGAGIAYSEAYARDAAELIPTAR